MSALLRRAKNIYRTSPPWLTAWLKYVPDGLLFGKGYRLAVPGTDCNAIGRKLKSALDYARGHTSWAVKIFQMLFLTMSLFSS